MEFPIAPSRVISYAVRYLTPAVVALLLEVSFAPAGWPAAALGLVLASLACPALARTLPVGSAVLLSS